jgi:copper chaperone CopZ
MPTAKFHVAELDSAAGEQRLVEQLNGIRGVYGAVANFADRCVEVDFEDDEVLLADIVASAREVGFTATLAG